VYGLYGCHERRFSYVARRVVAAAFAATLALISVALTGSATCRDHPVARTVAGAIIIGNVAATVAAHSDHEHTPPHMGDISSPNRGKRGRVSMISWPLLVRKPWGASAALADAAAQSTIARRMTPVRLTRCSSRRARRSQHFRRYSPELSNAAVLCTARLCRACRRLSW
jgi:hypothetical protein